MANPNEKNVNENKPKAKQIEAHGIGDLTRQLLVTPINPGAPKEEQVRLSNEEIAALVTKYYPDRKSKDGTKACVAWYCSQLNNDSNYRAKHKMGKPLPSKGGIKAKKVVTIDLE